MLRLKLWFAGAAAIIAAFGMAYLKGRRDEDHQHEFEDAEAYRETRKRIDADVGDIADARSAREFLRKRQNK